MDSNILTIVRKEVYDYLSNRTFLVILAIFSLLILVSAYQGVLTYDEQVQTYNEQIEISQAMAEGGLVQGVGPGGPGGNMSRIFDRFRGQARGLAAIPKPDTMDSFKSMVTFLGLVGGILALVLGFDAVSGEREKRSLNVLMTMPVFRDVVINSKIISRLIVVVIALGVSFTLGSVLIVGLTGYSPTGGDVARIVVMVTFCVLYVALFLGLGVLLSIKFSESSSALLWGVIIWLVLVILLPQMAGLVADALTPGSTLGRAQLFQLPQEEREEAMAQLNEELVRRQSIEDTVRLISPRTHFENAAESVLSKTTETAFTETGERKSISLGEAIANSWQNILALLVMTVLLFGSCYLLFTRMDLT